MPKLYRVLIPVTDIDAAQRFYTQVLQMPGERVSPGRHYFDCEGTIFACFDPGADGEGRRARANPEDVYIAVDDIETTYQLCREAGAVLVDVNTPETGPLGEIARRPWGEVSFYIHDPFGNPVCFVERTSVFTGS